MVRGPQVEMFASAKQRRQAKHAARLRGHQLRALERVDEADAQLTSLVREVEAAADFVIRPGVPTYIRLPSELREALDEQVIAHNRNRSDYREPRRTLADEICERLESTFGRPAAPARKVRK